MEHEGPREIFHQARVEGRSSQPVIPHSPQEEEVESEIQYFILPTATSVRPQAVAKEEVVWQQKPDHMQLTGSQAQACSMSAV